MAKKVLIFSLGYYPKHVGGAEVAIKNITDRIDPTEIEFHMVALRYDSLLPKVEKVGNVLVHRIGFTKKGPTMADLRRFPLHLNKILFQFLATYKAAELHLKHRYDGIWAMMAHSCGVPAGIFKYFFPKVKYLLTLQEGDPPEKIEKMARPVWFLFKYGFSSADMLQPISTFLERWGRRMGFAKQSVLIPNAVNISHFSKEYSQEDLEAFKVQIGKELGDVFLISTSRFVYKNATDDVIRALALLPDNVKFIADGEGPDLDMLENLCNELGLGAEFLVYAFGARADLLQAIASELGMSKSVRFFSLTNNPKGYTFAIRGRGPDLRTLKRAALDRGVQADLTLPVHGVEYKDSGLEKKKTRVIFFVQTGQEEMPKHMKSCDIAIRPSRSEGMGNSFVEAMAAKLPVIATQEGGIADFLFDATRNPDKPTTGWAVDKDSPKQIAEAVRDIISDPKKVARVVETAREMVVRKYDWELIAKDMREKVFANLL